MQSTIRRATRSLRRVGGVRQRRRVGWASVNSVILTGGIVIMRPGWRDTVVNVAASLTDADGPASIANRSSGRREARPSPGVALVDQRDPIATLLA